MVGGDWNLYLYIFYLSTYWEYGNVIIPIDYVYNTFQRGRYTTNQIFVTQLGTSQVMVDPSVGSRLQVVRLPGSHGCGNISRLGILFPADGVGFHSLDKSRITMDIPGFF